MIEGRRRRVQKRMKWLNGISNSMDMSWSKLWEMVKDRQAWCTTVPEVSKNWTWFSNWTTNDEWCWALFHVLVGHLYSWPLNDTGQFFLYCYAFVHYIPMPYFCYNCNFVPFIPFARFVQLPPLPLAVTSLFLLSVSCLLLFFRFHI